MILTIFNNSKQNPHFFLFGEGWVKASAFKCALFILGDQLSLTWMIFLGVGEVGRKEMKASSDSYKSTFTLPFIPISSGEGPLASKIWKEPPRKGSWDIGWTILGQGETLFRFLLPPSLIFTLLLEKHLGEEI